MARPHRPNPYEGARVRESGDDVMKRPWRATHVKQETAKERKERKRHEAEDRNARTRPENRRAYRRAQQAEAA